MIKKIMLLICIAFLFAGCGVEKEEKPTEFMRINGNEISQEEFRIYFEEAKANFEEIGGTDIWETDFDGRSAIEVAKESALNSMIAVKVSAQKATEFGIALDENTKNFAEESAANLIEVYREKGLEITEEMTHAMGRLMEDKELYNLVKDFVVKDYTISESEFQAYYESYYEDTAKMMQKLKIGTISCVDEETANEVYEKAIGGELFEELFSVYDINAAQSKNAGGYEIYQKDIEGELSHIIEAEEGFITKPLESFDGTWKVIKVLKIERSSQEEVKDKLRSDYTNTMWQQIFSKELEKWTQEADIERNEEAWKALEYKI